MPISETSSSIETYLESLMLLKLLATIAVLNAMGDHGGDGAGVLGGGIHDWDPV